MFASGIPDSKLLPEWASGPARQGRAFLTGPRLRADEVQVYRPFPGSQVRQLGPIVTG